MVHDSYADNHDHSSRGGGDSRPAESAAVLEEGTETSTRHVVLLLRNITSLLASLPMPARVLVTVGLLSPLGFFMGLPFPKAVQRVGELVAWGFSVNGAASVFGTTATVMIALSYGFVAALIVSALVYLTAFGLFSLSSAGETSA